MIKFNEFFHKGLEDLARQDRLRVCRSLQRIGVGRVRCQQTGRELVDFSSSDYLGLCTHPLLRDRAAICAQIDGSGTGASRVVTGLTVHMRNLEQRVAVLTAMPDARIFPSGWQANASLLPALARLSIQQTGEKAIIFADKLMHASLYHGCAAAGLRPMRFRHGDVAHLATLLEQCKSSGLRIVLTESVFSMEGDQSDIVALRAITQQYNALLCVDEAHAIGVLGENGAGLSRGFADIIVGTFSKALGSMGAFIASSKSACEWLDNTASGAVFSTALSPLLIGAIDAALDLLPNMVQARNQVEVLSERLRKHMWNGGVDIGSSTTHIIPILVGKEYKTMSLARVIEELGFLVVAIRPPTVPPDRCRLRVAICAYHTVEQVDALAHALLHAIENGEKHGF